MVDAPDLEPDQVAEDPESAPSQGMSRGHTFYSFDHKGYHFVVLDSIQPTDDRLWEAHVDEAQLHWLRDDLGRLPAGTPVIAVVHCPVVTAFATYAYAEIVSANRKYNTMTVANAPEVLVSLPSTRVTCVKTIFQ